MSPSLPQEFKFFFLAVEENYQDAPWFDRLPAARLVPVFDSHPGILAPSLNVSEKFSV
jgi:hypothetical protein